MVFLAIAKLELPVTTMLTIVATLYKFNFILREITMNTIKKAVELLLMAGLFANVATAATVVKPIESRHAIEININGIGPAVDRTAYKKLRKAIGDAVTNEVIDKFVIYGYAKEGGFSGCIEDRPSAAAPSRTFEALVKQLTAIKPNRKTTAYSINRVKTCPALVAEVEKPTTIFVSKADESKQCDATSGVSLSAMQTQLTNITVYSATKKSDGLIHITLCGADTGNYNVYEIAATDVEAAKKIGFSEWIEPR